MLLKLNCVEILKYEILIFYTIVTVSLYVVHAVKVVINYVLFVVKAMTFYQNNFLNKAMQYSM